MNSAEVKHRTTNFEIRIITAVMQARLITSLQYLSLIICHVSLGIFPLELVAKWIENGIKMD